MPGMLRISARRRCERGRPRKSLGGTLLQLGGPDWGAAKGPGGGGRGREVMTARRGLAGVGGDTRTERWEGSWRGCLPQSLERLVTPCWTLIQFSEAQT